MEQRWIAKAKTYLGQKEIKGSKHNPFILKWWEEIKSWFKDDETPWCAAFVGGVLEECGIVSSRSAAAKSYLNWGVKVSVPTYGAIVIFYRGTPTSGTGHVGFLVGRDEQGNLMVLGGNQGDKVSIATFSPSRVLGYRYPKGESIPSTIGTSSLAVYKGGKLSINEA